MSKQENWLEELLTVRFPQRRETKILVGLDGAKAIDREFWYESIKDHSPQYGTKAVHFETKYGIPFSEGMTNEELKFLSGIITKLKFWKLRGVIDETKMIRIYQLCKSKDTETARMGFEIFRGLTLKESV
jgi:hypothetical protein